MGFVIVVWTHHPEVSYLASPKNQPRIYNLEHDRFRILSSQSKIFHLI